jgi:hypothetical protein
MSGKLHTFAGGLSEAAGGFQPVLFVSHGKLDELAGYESHFVDFPLTSLKFTNARRAKVLASFD